MTTPAERQGQRKNEGGMLVGEHKGYEQHTHAHINLGYCWWLYTPAVPEQPSPRLARLAGRWDKAQPLACECSGAYHFRGSQAMEFAQLNPGRHCHCCLAKHTQAAVSTLGAGKGVHVLRDI